jgi:hypothetical protein
LRQDRTPRTPVTDPSRPGGLLLVGFKVGDTCRHLSSAYGIAVNLDVQAQGFVLAR